MSTNLVAFVVVLGVLIFFHELGHFLVARLFGVGVERFSLGFGPRILGKQVGITDYRISAIPLGGYVKMVGEEPDSEIDPADIPISFTHKHVFKRILIVAAGPFFNLLLAALIFYGVFQVSGLMILKPVVGGVEADTPAALAGLVEGDEIAAIDGSAIGSWEEMAAAISQSEGRPLVLTVKRGESLQDLTITMPPCPCASTGWSGSVSARGAGQCRQHGGGGHRGYPGPQAGAGGGSTPPSATACRAGLDAPRRWSGSPASCWPTTSSSSGGSWPRAQWDPDGGIGIIIPKVRLDHVPTVTTIPVDSDEALRPISDERNLALNPNDMPAIANISRTRSAAAAGRGRAVRSHRPGTGVYLPGPQRPLQPQHLQGRFTTGSPDTGHAETIDSLFKTCIQRPPWPQGAKDWVVSVLWDNAGVGGSTTTTTT
jgi:hypothetical protein